MPALREDASEDASEDDVAAVEALVKGAAAAAVAAVSGGGAAPAKKGFGTAAKGFGAAAAAAAVGAALASQKLPDFAAMLRKGTRVGFPELAAWSPAAASGGKEDQVTASEGVAMLLDFALRAAARAPAAPLHLWLPGEFMAAAVTLGSGKLGPSVTVGVPGGSTPSGAAPILWAIFDPAAVEADAGAATAGVAGAKAAGAPIVLVPVGRVKRAALPDGATAAQEALRARAATRLAKASA
jgi:hypothetical protein